jgi:histone H4
MTTCYLLCKMNRVQGGVGLPRRHRHRRLLRDSILGVTNPAIRRLARRGGVKRISGLIYDETRGCLKIFLQNIVRDSVVFTEHAKRKTVTSMDVLHALKRSGITLYGYTEQSYASAKRKPSIPAIEYPADPAYCHAKMATVGAAEMKILQDESAYLNDKILNASMCQYVIGSGYYPMSTYLASKGMSDEGFERLERWFKLDRDIVPKGVKNIMGMKGMIVPYNEHGIHWTVAMVDFASHKIVYYDSLYKSGSSQVHKLVNFILDYLNMESKSTYKGKVPFRFDRKEWKVVIEDTPRQSDAWNCGVYSIMRVRKWMLGDPIPSSPSTGRLVLLDKLFK